MKKPSVGLILLNSVLLTAILMVSCTSATQLTATATADPVPYKVNLPTVVNIQPSIFGMNLPSMDTAGGLPMALAANIRWVRAYINWKDVQATEGGAYDWSSPGISSLEAQLINATANKLKVEFLISGTPDWAKDPSLLNKPNCDGRIQLGKIKDFASFVQAVTARYGVSPYNIDYVELYNEPDAAGVMGCWGDPTDTNYYGGEAYGEMLKVIYPAVKAVNPRINLLIGGLLMDCDPFHPPAGKDCTVTKFFDGILNDGAGADFDGISFHAYDYYGPLIGQYNNKVNWNSDNTTGPVVLAKSNYLNNVLKKYNVTNKFLLSSESALVCKNDYCKKSTFPQRLPDFETTKAYYVAEVFTSSMAANFKANLWYSIFSDLDNNSGLLNADMTPLPAYYSYQFTSTKLAGDLFIQQINTFPGVWVYAFTLPNGNNLWVLWSIDLNPHLVNLPSMPYAVNLIGTDGKPAPQILSQTLTVGAAPVFVEMAK